MIRLKKGMKRKGPICLALVSATPSPALLGQVAAGAPFRLVYRPDGEMSGSATVSSLKLQVGLLFLLK